MNAHIACWRALELLALIALPENDALHDRRVHAPLVDLAHLRPHLSAGIQVDLLQAVWRYCRRNHALDLALLVIKSYLPFRSAELVSLEPALRDVEDPILLRRPQKPLALTPIDLFAVTNWWKAAGPPVFGLVQEHQHVLALLINCSLALYCYSPSATRLGL
ncbi:uncharacterized protein PHALS_08495 [Plasmopara halstedii]|uniref:Uncharacterized protein n=1 Tax=Plasmopara halstedii TaxID=4781 RepID=A0A0P1ADJ6_PLAHL|nr:uncharacterized protein PHALS_08495 [Plasmopara halstedii]CEG38417.1 hypothetical protein PHALS_08495 [Plasmopara halstedii]|eukprot:XP_024574786.1 hypothetical protein PHALS_08495 [Plasmopara halstedii]